MNDNPMTFCISCCNNLNYLKLAIHSVRTYSNWNYAPLIVFAENCTDGTDEWLEKNKERYNLTTIIQHNDEEHTFGIGGGMNRTAELVYTEYIMFLHADFFVSKNWDLEAMKIFDKYPNIPMWVSSQRFQPNLFKENSRPGTLVFDYSDFGYKYDDFNEEYFIQYAEEFSKMNTDIEYEKGEGVSGLIRKKDWDYIGGCDDDFNPAYFDDKDIFLRMQLEGYKFILTTNSVIFHFGSRSDKSNFPDDEIKRSERSKFYERRSAERFFQKWKFWPVHNQHQFDIIPAKELEKIKNNKILEINCKEN